MAKKNVRIHVRKTGGYSHLAEGKPLAGLPVLKRRQLRVEKCKAALKAAAKEGDMSRIRSIKAHLSWAQERLANTADRVSRKLKPRRRAA